MAFGRKKTQRDDDPLAALRRRNRPSSDKSDKDTVFAHEQETARMIGGKRHRGSGASPWMKSDASSAEYQFECKQTGDASMSLKLEWLQKISMEAAGMGKTPGLHVRFLRDMPGVSQDWVMVPASEFKRLLHAAGGQNEGDE